MRRALHRLAEKDMRPALTLLSLLFISCSGGLVYSQLGREEMPDASKPCGLNFKVTGAQFSPGMCRFEIISAGPACPSNTGCPPDYALSMKDSARSHIKEVMLFNFKSFARQTYRFDPAQNLKDFNGQLLDERAVARNLLKGEVSLEPLTSGDTPADPKVRVSFDVSFPNAIRIQGSGEVPVKHVSAP